MDATAAKHEGMRRAHQGANPAWRILMTQLVEQTAREMLTFTSDDVFDRYDKVRGAPVTTDNRAFGPVMHRAAALGQVRKANVAPINSRRVELHSSPRTVWQSLICECPANV